MGNVLAHAAPSDGGAEQDDLRFLGLSTSALFLDSFVSQEYERLPAFEGTELPDEAAEDGAGEGADEGGAAGRKDGQGPSSTEDGKTRRLLEILVDGDGAVGGTTAPTPAAAVRVEDGRAGGGRGAVMLSRMRSRMLQRMHLAILREGGRVSRAASRQRQQQREQEQQGVGDGRGDSGHDLLPLLLGGLDEERGDDGDEEDGGGGGMVAADGPAVLNMASMRVSLAVLKAVGGSNPEVFVEFCQNLLGLFQACPAPAFAQIQRHRAQRETLEQIRDFALGVVTARPAPTTTPGARCKEREHALALLFGLGVARGSVHDLVEVAALLASGEGGATAIPAVGPFWGRLTTYEHRYRLAVFNPLEPDGPEILIQTGGDGGGAAAAKTDASGAATTAAAAASAGAAALACDGAYLYIWDCAFATLQKVGTGRRGTVAGKVYLRRTDVIRVVQMLGSHGAAGGQPQPLQPVEAEMDGLEGSETRVMVRIRRRSSVRDDPDIAAAVRATLAAGEEHEVIEEEVSGPGNLHWVRVRAGWLLDGGGRQDDEEGDDEEESKEEEGTAATTDLSQSIATLGFPDISSLGALEASTSASTSAAAAVATAATAAVSPERQHARPSAPVPDLSPSRPGSAAEAEAALEFFHVRAGTRPGVAPPGRAAATALAAAEAGEDGEAAWLAHVDGKLYFKSKAHMAPLDLAVLSAATLRVERVHPLLLPGLEAEDDDGGDGDAAVDTAPLASVSEEQDGDGPRSGPGAPAAGEPAAAVGDEPTTVEYATVSNGARVRAEDADVARTAGLLHALQRAQTPPEQGVLMDGAEVGDGWRGFPLPAAEEAETTALRTLTLDLGEPRPLTRLGAVFTRGDGARLTMVLFFVSRDGRDFQSWPDPASSPATSPPEENPASPYFVEAPAPVPVRFVRFGFALEQGEDGVWVQRLHAQGPPQEAAVEAGGSTVGSGRRPAVAVAASSPRRRAPVIPGFTTDGQYLHFVYTTPNDNTGSATATVDPEADGAAPQSSINSTLHVAALDPVLMCADGGYFAASIATERLLLHKGLVTNGHQLFILSGHNARAVVARGRTPAYRILALGMRRWPSDEMGLRTFEQHRFVFEGGNSSSGGPPAATPSFLPRAFAYDPHNNVTWGAELFAEGGGKVSCWSNAGNLAPPIHALERLSDLQLSLKPSMRRLCLKSAATKAEQEPDAPEDQAQIQAALILSCLDHCAEPYGAAAVGGLGGGSPVAGLAPEPLSVVDHGAHELVVMAASKEEGLGQRRARFVVWGRTLASGALGAPFERGLNLVRLDAGYAPVETRGFDTTGRSGAGYVYNDLLLEYVSRLPDGTVVLVASQEDVGRGMTPAGQAALEMLGGNAALLARLREAPNDSSYALIGRKGARFTSARVVQHLGRRGSHASVRLRLPVVPVPLCVEPTSPTLRALVRVVLAHKEAALAVAPRTASDTYRAVHVLSALSLLTTNVHVLMRACPPAAAATVAAQQLRGLFEPAELQGLHDFLVEVLACPQMESSYVGPSLGEAALRLFVTALDIFYPTPSGQTALLAQLIGRYAQNALTPLEATVLGLLLKRIANPSSLLALIDEQCEQGVAAAPGVTAGSIRSFIRDPAVLPSLDLFRSILTIAEKESAAALAKLSAASIGNEATRASRSAADPPPAPAASPEIGYAATTMLASLANQLLSHTVQEVLVANKTAAASEGRDAAVARTARIVQRGGLALLLEIVDTLGTSCRALLDAALAVLEEQPEQEEGEADGRQGAAAAATARMERALSRATSLSLSPSRSGLPPRGRASSTASLSSKGGHGYGPPQRWRDLEATLQASPVGALLPLLVLVVMEVARYQAPALLPALRDLVRALSPLTQRVHRLVACLPPAAAATTGTRVAAVGGCTTRSQVYESAHPYLPNTDQSFVIHFPKAARIVVSFDPQTRTETNYDYFQFWKDAGRTQSCHPQIEKFSGRSGNENWPGFGNRPPLVIEGDIAYCFFHTDSSNEDWGWRFTATAYFKATAVVEDAHWLLVLERHLNACSAALAGGLVASVPWQGELEARNRPWVEGPDAVLGGDWRLSDEGAQEAFNEMDFLQSLIARAPGSHAAALVGAMRLLVAEDRGRHPSVDKAVYASIAALLWHNGLATEAVALAERAAAGDEVGVPDRVEASPSLLRAWRAGAKMRHFFAFADVRAGLQGAGQHQQQQLPLEPSLYDGAEDAVVDAAAAEVVERAQFLLIQPPAASCFPVRRTRTLSHHQAPPAAPVPGGATEGQWAAVVEELHASSPSILEVFAQRRTEAQREHLARLCSTTERVLRFLQAPVKVEEVKLLYRTRTERAICRTQGLGLLTELLAQTSAVPMQVDLLVGFMQGLRKMPQAIGDGGAPCPSATIHVRAGLSGCSLDSARALGSAYAEFLRALVQILWDYLPFLLQSPTGAAAEARRRLALAALKACTLDHWAFAADHALLDASGLLPTLEGYLAVPDPALRAAVWALLESLLNRPGAEPGAAVANHHDTDAAGRLHGRLLGLVFRLLERTIGAAASSSSAGDSSNGPWALRRAVVGPILPYTRLTLGTTIAFWLFRPGPASGGREQEQQPGLLKPGDRVQRGPDWCDGDEDGWVGNVGTVIRMETPTAAIVEWNGLREEQFIYRWGAMVEGRKMYDLVAVPEQGAGGGLLLFKGTESLLGAAATATTTPTDAGGGEDGQEGNTQAEPWSALGLSRTETSRLLFRTCAGGEGLRAPTTFAVLGNRPLPCGEWVHVACDISKKSVVLYVNGEVEAEKPLPASLLYQRGSSAAASGSDAAATPIEDFNPSPLFVGQPPSYATGEKGAEGLLHGLTVACRSLSAEEIKGLAAQRPPVEPEPRSTATAQDSKDEHLLDAISLARKCLRFLPTGAVRDAVEPTVVQAVLGLVVGDDASASAWGLQVRVAATRLAAALLPFVDDRALGQLHLPGAPATPKASSSLAGKATAGDAAAGKRAALVATILEAVGAFLVAPHVVGAAGASAADSVVLESAESRAGLAHQRLALLRSLAQAQAWSRAWADAVLEVVGQVLKSLPALLTHLGAGSATDDEAEAEAEEGGIEGAATKPLALAAAVLALLGGDAEGLAVGADVLVEAADRKGCAEEGVLLALTHAAGGKDEAPRGLGGAVVVALRSDPTRPQVYPRERVTPQPCRDQGTFLRLVAEATGPDALLNAFRCLVGHELRGGPPRQYAPKVVEELQTHEVESPHPHERGADLQLPLRFPGAKSIEVVFDEQSRTAWGKAHVQFLKEKDSLEWFGKEKYQGRDREQCWAGAHGAPPLVIPAASCVVRFVSDATEEPDWGFKLTARAHTVREVPPPELPPSYRYAARAQLCMQGTKALAALLQVAPPLGHPAAAAGLLQALVGSALAGGDAVGAGGSQARGRYRRRATPLELESAHPYSNNVERYEEVAFPGAKRLVVRFDARSSTEKSCDFVRFYKDESRTAYWGENQYTGGKDGSAAVWPGVGATPPLVINSDRCVVYFHSDGSVVDWGWRCWVTPDFGDDGLDTMGLGEVGARIFMLHQCLCDGAKPQQQAAGLLASFQRLPRGALPTAARTTCDAGSNQDEEALAELCGALSLEEAAPAGDSEPQDEDAAVLALAKARSRARVIGRRFVVNRRDAGSVAVRAAPDAVAPMLGMLDMHDQPVVALEERGEWLRIDWKASPATAAAWVQRRRNDQIFLVPADEDGSGGAQDALLVLPNEELEDDDVGVQTRRGSSMYECADVALVGTAAAASPSASAARSDGESLHPADCVGGQQLRLRSALTELQLHAARGFAKRSVAALLLQWPEAEPLDLAVGFGGPKQFLQFLAVAFQDEQQQAAAAAASAGGGGAGKGADGGGVPGAGGDSPLLQVLRRTIRQVLGADAEDGRGDGAAFARTLLGFALRQFRETAGLYASVTPTRGVLKSVETPHPYPDNADLSWTVSIPGASRLKLVWDPRSSTEPNCDYVALYADTDHSDDNRVSPQNFSGRANDMDASWPGVGGRPPVYVDADHVDIVFRSDASNNDWGCKIYAFGLFKEPTEAELAAFRAKKKALRPHLALACWLLDVLAAEPLPPLVARALYAPPTLAAVTEFIARVGPRERVWMAQLACSLLSHLQQPAHATPLPPRLPPRSVAELRRLVAVLRSQAHAQVALEAVADSAASHQEAEDSGSEEDAETRRQRERQEGHHKSALLQSLIQATLLGEACPLSPSSLSSSTPQQPAPDAGASAMDLWLGTVPAATRELAMPGLSDTVALSSGAAPWATAASGSSGGAQTLRKLRAAVDYMRSFVDRTVPAEAVERFLAEEQQRLRVVYECGSPPPDGDDGPSQLLVERVCIPGAAALEVRIDATTRLGPRDVIRVAETAGVEVGAGAVVLRGMDRGSDPQGAEVYGLCVGDLVVRGPGWCWGSEDGGPGSVGEVIELRAWKGRPAKGARVRWPDGRVGLYRWAYDGVYDVAYLKPGERSTRPIRMRGDQLHLAVERLAAPPTPPEGEGDEGKALEGEEEQTAAAAAAAAAASAEPQPPFQWRGALCFDGLRPVVAIPDLPAVELTGDFSISLWCRLDATMAPTGRSSTSFTLVSRALEGLDDGNGAPVHQLLLSVEPGSGQLVLSMMNQQMRTGVRLVGSTCVQRKRWTYVAVAVEGQRARLYANDARGTEIASGLFGGQRLISMGAPLCVGAVQGRDDSHWSGHIWDLRLYDRALSAHEVSVLADGPAGDGGGGSLHAGGLICHFLAAPEGVVPRMPAPRVACNAVGAGQGTAEVQDCMWDDEIEPLPVLEQRAAAASAAADEAASLQQPAAQQQPGGGSWGYRITVLPVFPSDPAAIAQILLLAERFAPFAAPYTAGSFKLDLALARHVNRTAQQRRWGVEELLACRRFEEVAPKEEDLVRLPLLRQLLSTTVATTNDAAAAATDDAAADEPARVAACRFQMLQQLNRHVREVILLIDLGSIDRPWSVAHLLSRCRGLVYHSVKAPCWRKALAATACVGTVAELHLSRSRAAKLQASGQVDHDARATVFGQAFRALHGLPPRGFRRADKAWNVVWRGESSQDAGGPYRESWSVFSLELQSPVLPLLRRTPNGVHAVGQNREHWVLNPGATGELALELFAFLGKLLGMVLRNGELLHLDLSSLVWKLLGSEPLAAPEDLEAVDVEIARSLRLLRGMSREEFEAAFADHLDFTCVATDGRTVDLVPGGVQRAVGYDERLEYARLVEQYRLHEFDVQAAAVRAGLATIVPARLLALFTWEEIEVMVCGLKQVDVVLLRQVVEYCSGVRPDDPHVQYFWQVLEEWSDEERSMFIRFCWGRSRLPLRAEDFPQRFKIQHFGRAPADNYLPVAHTCFFSLELPAYSSLDVCRRKLTLAISACSEIDADENAIGAQAAAMGWED